MTKIYELNNHILIHAEYADPAEHRHMAAHIIVAGQGGMKVKAAGREIFCRGAMIPSGEEHKVDTCGNSALVFLFDSTTSAARKIQAVKCISEEECEEILELFAEFENGTADKLEEYVMKMLGVDGYCCCITDERIAAAVKYIRAGGSEKLTCREVAEAVFLSQGRFSHLFRAQTGMTFAAYLIYQRVMSVYAMLFQGKTVTEAAHEAGFSSSTHFADVNRRLFGLSVREITRDVTFVKVK